MSQEASKYQFVVWESRNIIPEHYPIIPAEFTDVTYVGGATAHYGFWHFAIGHVYVITSRGANKCFQFNTMVP